ncbi:isochorismate lyase [Vogesella sp. DC21W]|uniref:chorismate mutase n=1 Tax=Vogesella aquatica TaxID=2984206 RepID=A0ABT5IYS5_9NEIS|nr:isochorismate lyase [Vogesella aquatica]MDC7717728.1 isochorismate lyase [Vogesella aquatica]
MHIANKLTPAQCSNMDDIRAEIDLLDRAVVGLISQRYQYVLAAAKFKTSATAVRAPERFAAMLAQRRQWAEQEGLNADAIERLFSDLVNHFIAEEMQHWQQQQN